MYVIDEVLPLDLVDSWYTPKKCSRIAVFNPVFLFTFQIFYYSKNFIKPFSICNAPYYLSGEIYLLAALIRYICLHDYFRLAI